MIARILHLSVQVIAFGLAAALISGCHEDGGSKDDGWLKALQASKSPQSAQAQAKAVKPAAPAKSIQPWTSKSVRGPSVVRPLQVKPTRGPSPLRPLKFQSARTASAQPKIGATLKAPPKPPTPPQSKSDESWWHSWFSKKPRQ